MEARVGGAVHRAALEWSGVLEFRQQFRQGHARFAPTWAAATAIQRLEILREITAPVSFCSHPDRKKANFMLVRRPGLSDKMGSFSDRNRNHY
jgi:hypothetical protein